MERPEGREYTPEEYLTLEEKSSGRHEYFDGRIYAMTGGSADHARIAGNAFAALRARFAGRPCEAFISDIKVRVEASGLYTYPDVSALCGPPRFESERHGVLLNPSVLVEVLSPSTASYDRGQKFAHYRRVPSLREYVLVEQDQVHVERFARVDARGDEWAMSVIEDIEASVELPSIDCAIPLRELYERVELAPRSSLRAVYERPAEEALA